MPLRVAPKP